MWISVMLCVCKYMLADLYFSAICSTRQCRHNHLYMFIKVYWVSLYDRNKIRKIAYVLSALHIAMKKYS